MSVWRGGAAGGMGRGGLGVVERGVKKRTSWGCGSCVLVMVLCVVVGRRQRCYLGMGRAAYRLIYGKGVLMGFNGRAFG